MINLVCFPHYTAGGLVCDILGETFSPVGSNGGINSINHSLGKIGDTATVLTDFDQQAFDQLTQGLAPGTWVGTHCWAGLLDVEKYGHIINITTATHRSRVYRWMRAYRHYFAKTWDLESMTAMEQTDKLRETAKNYLKSFDPVTAANVVNIEFADIVENTQEFLSAMGNKPLSAHVDRWQKINDFLYTENLWNNPLVLAYYQAEMEQAHNRYYIYE